MYDVKSPKAEEFISHQEILDTLAYAEENKENRELLDQILAKAATFKGLNHREAAVLLECPLPEYKEKLFALAKEIKKAIYGDRIVLFAPLYLSNYCINGCVYCPYHSKNRDIKRKKLTQEQIKEEVIALEAMGHKRIVIESGEDPLNLKIIRNCMMLALVPIHYSKKRIIRKIMKLCIQQDRRVITRTIQKRWTALWKAASMM